MAISITASFLVLTPAPYEVAIDAAELFAPMLSARNPASKTDKIINKVKTILLIQILNLLKNAITMPSIVYLDNIRTAKLLTQ